MDQHVVFIFFLIFTGGALLASLALFGRQPLLVAYIALGALNGPLWSGLGLRCRAYRTDIIYRHCLLTFSTRLRYAASITA